MALDSRLKRLEEQRHLQSLEQGACTMCGNQHVTRWLRTLGTNEESEPCRCTCCGPFVYALEEFGQEATG